MKDRGVRGWSDGGCAGRTGGDGRSVLGRRQVL
jgi:hypothetical protein